MSIGVPTRRFVQRSQNSETPNGVQTGFSYDPHCLPTWNYHGVSLAAVPFMRLVWIAVFGSLSGCSLVFDGGRTGDDVCTPVAELQPALRNPFDLTCSSFGGCDPSCGPCALPPIPAWGVCGSPCDALDEATCSKRSDCRVVKDARCSISATCITDFVGCFATSLGVDSGINCTNADAETCSRSPACTAYHRTDPCPLDAQCPRSFALCMPSDRPPGTCFAPVACDRLQPPCPTGTTAGIIEGCYSGACIPNDVCEPQ